MMKTGIAVYFGITTGRGTPDFVNTMVAFYPNATETSASKTPASLLYETGLNFGMLKR